MRERAFRFSPMVPMTIRLLAAAASTALLAFAVNDALACACCTNTGQRYVGMQRLDTTKRAEIDQLRFAEAAQLFVGEADPDDVKGITTPSVRYKLSAGWDKDRLVFAFRDEAGRSGTLALQRPGTISVFEVDPRDQPDSGLGPALYKEWTLTSRAAGSGVFSAGLGPNQQLSLVMHGHGNSCTTIDHFTHWTLLMQGPKARYSLFGDLVSTP
jgi:hypothetical protein